MHLQEIVNDRVCNRLTGTSNLSRRKGLSAPMTLEAVLLG